MKKLVTEIRMYIAELLLNLAFSIASSQSKDGRLLKTLVVEYIKEVWQGK